MGKASAARKRFYIIVSAILFSLTTPVPASAQGAEYNREESWNIAVFASTRISKAGLRYIDGV